jgi:hypothetical protein
MRMLRVLLYKELQFHISDTGCTVNGGNCGGDISSIMSLQCITKCELTDYKC